MMRFSMEIFMRYFVLILLTILSFSLTANAQDIISADPPLRWWKGNTHTHTFWSDGDDFPEMVAEWYRQRGYNFLGLSDHNILSQGQKWMKLGEIERRAGK